jgi:hypothetical protein
VGSPAQLRRSAYVPVNAYTGSYRLPAATLRLSVPTGETPTLLLMSDVGGNPSATLFTFTDPAFGSGIQNYAFTPPSPFTLLSGTTYWLVMQGNAATSDTSWSGSSPSLAPTGPGAGSAGSRIGGSFLPTADFTLVLVASYQIDGTPAVAAVPAPPTLLLGVAGLGIAGLARLRRQGTTVPAASDH